VRTGSVVYGLLLSSLPDPFFLNSAKVLSLEEENLDKKLLGFISDTFARAEHIAFCR